MTHKKPLGVSQGTLNLSRNRSHRILEAVIDKHTQKPIKEPVIDCPHYDYCCVKNFGRINCITSYKNCQTFKYHERYGGNDANKLFI